MDKLIYDSMAFQRAGISGKRLQKARAGTRTAQAKGAAAGLGTALSMFPVMKLGQNISKVLAPVAFDASRRGFIETAAKGTALVALSSRLPVQEISRTAQAASKAARHVGGAVQHVGGAVMRFTGHRMGTSVPSIEKIASFEKALRAGQALPGRLGLNIHNIRQAMSPVEKAISRFANSSSMPPVPPNPVINQSLNVSNRFFSPTGRPMSPRVFQRQLNSLRGLSQDKTW